MSAMLRCAVVAVTVVLAAGAAEAQQADQEIRGVTLQQLVLDDGSTAYGTVESDRDGEIVFRTHLGAVLKVRRDRIKSLREVSGSVIRGEFLVPDPNTSRLFFGPTGRSLPKGRAYVGFYEAFIPFVQVGVTDRFSIGAGTPMLALDESQRPAWVTPKLQVYRSPATQVSVGAMHFFNGPEHGDGVGYVVMTHGSDARSFTGGAGLGYTREGGRAGVVMLAGEARINRNMKAVTENHFWKGGNSTVMGGVRLFGEKFSTDLALGAFLGDVFFIYPVVNFAYIF
jgi:hypothetical protein